jgi:hypothetical protein
MPSSSLRTSAPDSGSSSRMKDQRTPRVRSNSLPASQDGSDSEEGAWSERENRDLVAGGFESSDDGDDLWSKDGVWYGRKAALQNLGH